jgi:hypothetical protein
MGKNDKATEKIRKADAEIKKGIGSPSEPQPPSDKTLPIKRIRRA